MRWEGAAPVVGVVGAMGVIAAAAWVEVARIEGLKDAPAYAPWRTLSVSRPPAGEGEAPVPGSHGAPPSRDERLKQNLMKQSLLLGLLTTQGDAGGTAADLWDEPWPEPTPSRAQVTERSETSTIALDVDTGSWPRLRAALGRGVVPSGVRVEEVVNYLDFDDPPPTDDAPIAVRVDVAPDPAQAGHHVVRVGLKAREEAAARPPVHLEFLVDVSGSMDTPEKLPLAKDTLRWLVGRLGSEDEVGLVTYAGDTREVLPMTPVTRSGEIREAIDALDAGGGTGMDSGMTLAYRAAARAAKSGVATRVIVLSDGDANIGSTSWDGILADVAREADRGIALTTVGFGADGRGDELMEQLADHGNGAYYAVDSDAEARRVFGDRLPATTTTVAWDAKAQVTFDPGAVKRWRLVGYEDRAMAAAGFRDDTVDGGEVGAGQGVTAVYDVVLAKGAEHLADVRVRAKTSPKAPAREWTTSVTSADVAPSFAEASADLRVAWVAATWADLVRGGPNPARVRYEDLAYAAGRNARPGHPEDVELQALITETADVWNARTVASR